MPETVIKAIISLVTGTALTNVLGPAIGNWLLSIASFWVSITAVLLNVSITYTLHIRQFIENNSGVYAIWLTIRDLSGIFIIFLLLFAGIKMILGLDHKMGELIKNIVIVGILINFSFFLTGVMIDASNVVSMTLYHAIAPTEKADVATVNACKGSMWCIASNSFTSGGISNIFLQSLAPQKVFDAEAAKNALTSNNGTVIMLFEFTGVVIMIVTGLSFLIAALAFIYRFILLVAVLAFSPIWFASMVVPGLSNSGKKWWDALLGQLVIMPVYLLLLYAALKVLTTMDLAKNLNYTALAAQGTQGFITMVVNYIFVIFILNLPLVAAAKISTSFGGMNINLGKYGAEAIWKKVGNKTKDFGKGYANRYYRETVSRGASAVARSEKLKTFAANYKVGELALKGIQKTGSSYDKKLDTQVAARSNFAQSLGYDQNLMNQAQGTLRNEQSLLATAKANNAPQAVIDTHEANISAAKRNITTIEKARQDSYANRINKPKADTLYQKVARKNKVAAAKIQIPIIEKQLTQRKESLTETKTDIKQLLKVIRGQNAPGPGLISIPPHGFGTLQQQTDLAQYQQDEVNKTNQVNGLQAQIDGLKLVK